MSGFKLQFVGKPISNIPKEEVQQAAYALYCGNATEQQQVIIGGLLRSHIITPDVEEPIGDLFDDVNYPCCLSIPVAAGGDDLNVVSEILGDLVHMAKQCHANLEFEGSDELRELVKSKEERTMRFNPRPLTEVEKQQILSSKHMVPFLEHTGGPRTSMASSNLQEAEAIENARHTDRAFESFKESLQILRNNDDGIPPNARVEHNKALSDVREYLTVNTWNIAGEPNTSFIDMLTREVDLLVVDHDSDPDKCIAEYYFARMHSITIIGKSGSC